MTSSNFSNVFISFNTIITAVVGISKLGEQRLKVWCRISRRPDHGWGQGAKKILKIELLNWLKMAKSVLSNDSFSNTRICIFVSKNIQIYSEILSHPKNILYSVVFLDEFFHPSIYINFFIILAVNMNHHIVVQAIITHC